MKIPARPPAMSTAVFGDDLAAFVRLQGLVNVSTDEYLPWEKLRWRPTPEGVTAEQWWVVTAVQRQGVSRQLPLRRVDGRQFSYALPDQILRRVERVNRRAGGLIGIREQVTNPATRDRFLISGLMEEAITSSQLEGATTTRRAAKRMLRAGRRPRTHDEQMIWNNWQAMAFVREHRDQQITPALVRELHAIVTDSTLDNPADAGRLQRPEDVRVQVTTVDDLVLHTPPRAEELSQRLAELCDFANAVAADSQPWLPALLRAIVVHFMIGHDHYFVDGNGRLARALFYWVMLKEGFWLTEFVTISTILAKAPVQYAHAYVNTEYEGDLTFFIDYQLRVLDRAFDSLDAYLAAKVQETERLRARMRMPDQGLNHRQLAVLEAAMADPHQDFTMASHSASHNVVRETARRDLFDLEDRGLLVRRKRGRAFHWSASSDLGDLL